MFFVAVWGWAFGAGRIVGVDASANMLAQARAKAERRGWTNIDLENADATTLTPGWLNGRLGPERGAEGAEAVLFTYSLSVMTNWPEAWRAATATATATAQSMGRRRRHADANRSRDRLRAPGPPRVHPGWLRYHRSPVDST